MRLQEDIAFGASLIHLFLTSFPPSVLHFFFYKDQQIFFEAGMSLTFSDFQAETSLKCP